MWLLASLFSFYRAELNVNEEGSSKAERSVRGIAAAATKKPHNRKSPTAIEDPAAARHPP
jgi:hypothetical protein